MKSQREKAGSEAVESLKIPKATWMADGTHWPGTWIHTWEEHSKGDHAGIIQEQVLRYDQENDEVVQVSGSFELVQEALFNITSRIREAIFLHKPYAGSSMSQHSSDNPPKRSRIDMNAGQSHTSDSNDRVPLVYNGENVGFYSKDLLSSGLQDTNDGNTRGSLNTGADYCSSGSVPQTPVVTSKTVEVVLPREELGYVHGEDDSHLTMITEISGAEVTICDPKLGESEGKVIVSGNPIQIHIAVSLVQGFNFHGRWSMEFGELKGGSPEIHVMLAEYIYSESPELDMSKVSAHFVRGNDRDKFASTLVNFMGRVGTRCFSIV